MLNQTTDPTRGNDESGQGDPKVTKLADILKRLNEGGDPATAREDAREFLGTVSPADLSRAEQQLMREGMAPEQLRHLCAMHIEMVGERATRMAAELDPGHIIHTMIGEHETMLACLDELVELNRGIHSMGHPDEGPEQLPRLRELAERMLDFEPHHRREEEVLFPELQTRGISAPCEIIATEHDEIRARKGELASLAQGVDQMDFADFKARLDTVATLLVLTLRDHIRTENGILYPTALEVIDDDEVWERMKAESYKIDAIHVTPR